MTRPCLLLLLVGLLWPIDVAAQQKTRDQKVRDDREKVTAEGFWIYNDLPAAFAEAKKTGKPIVVVLRCIPCEECVKLDDDLVDRDPVLKPLLEKFVCVRVISTNGLDLSLFHYDTDQSFAVFMLNADRTIYGRFGTRSHRTEWFGDVSLTGLAKALEGALELHAAYPGNKDLLTTKTGPRPLFERPELMPGLNEKYTSALNYAGDVAKSCVHCHQIGDALRDYYRARNEPIPDTVLNPYPHPKSIGFILDPDERATVKEITPKSLAEKAGFKPGDQIESFGRQPMLSMADVQWVLNLVPATGGEVEATVRRGSIVTTVSLALPDGWRNLDDISWRVSAWGLRRMVTGGLVLEAADDETRTKQRIAPDKMALRVRYVGEYGEHAAGKKAGFQKDDILLSFDGRTDLTTESALFRYGVTKKKPGDTVPVALIRDGKPMRLELPMQR
jgi:serine protease Do